MKSREDKIMSKKIIKIIAATLWIILGIVIIIKLTGLDQILDIGGRLRPLLRKWKIEYINEEKLLNKSIIQLAAPIDSKKIILSPFETNFIIKFGYNDFEDQLINLQQGGPFIDIYRNDLLPYIQTQIKVATEIDSHQLYEVIATKTKEREKADPKFFSSANFARGLFRFSEYDSLESIFITLLESGKAIIYDKENNRYLKSIIIEHLKFKEGEQQKPRYYYLEEWEETRVKTLEGEKIFNYKFNWFFSQT